MLFVIADLLLKDKPEMSVTAVRVLCKQASMMTDMLLRLNTLPG